MNIYLSAQTFSSDAQLLIVDALGRLVQTLPTEGETFFTLPLGEWAAGLYFLQVLEDGAVKSVEKFIVEK